MNPGELADEYYRAVEEEFVRRRGTALLLSPRDWSLIAEWKAAGVPLRVILQGIHNVFDAFERRAPAGRRINSLSYCRQEVLALHAIYRALHAVEAGRPAAGGPEAAGATAVARHVGRLHRRVRLAMSTASQAGRDLLVGRLARIAADLKEVRRKIKSGAFEPQGLEEQMRRLDEEMLDAARASLPPDAVIRIGTAAKEAMGAAAERMTPEARESTRKTLFARLLREACALPRLTLFD